MYVSSPVRSRPRTSASRTTRAPLLGGASASSAVFLERLARGERPRHWEAAPGRLEQPVAGHFSSRETARDLGTHSAKSGRQLPTVLGDDSEEHV